MTIYVAANAWLEDKNGKLVELPTEMTLALPDKSDKEPVYHFDAAGGTVGTITFTLTDEQAEAMARVFRHYDYRRYVAPLVYRVQSPRSRLVRVGGMALNNKTTFVRRLLGG